MIKFDDYGYSINAHYFDKHSGKNEPLFYIARNGRKEWVIVDRSTGRVECASKRRKDCEREISQKYKHRINA